MRLTELLCVFSEHRKSPERSCSEPVVYSLSVTVVPFLKRNSAVPSG